MDKKEFVENAPVYFIAGVLGSAVVGVLILFIMLGYSQVIEARALQTCTETASPDTKGHCLRSYRGTNVVIGTDSATSFLDLFDDNGVRGSQP